MNHDLKSRPGIRRIAAALRYSKDGITAAWQHEAAFRQLCLLHGILLFLLLLLPFSGTLRLYLLLCSFLSVITELLNTAIEAAVDLISPDIHPLAKRAKDCGSAAQLFALILLGISWAAALFLLIK